MRLQFRKILPAWCSRWEPIVVSPLRVALLHPRQNQSSSVRNGPKPTTARAHIDDIACVLTTSALAAFTRELDSSDGCVSAIFIRVTKSFAGRTPRKRGDDDSTHGLVRTRQHIRGGRHSRPHNQA